MSTPDVLLALLGDGAQHGYELKRRHDAWFPHSRPLAYAQVYATLGRLDRDGLVGVAHTEAGGGPERTLYALTASGEQRLATWLGEPVPIENSTVDELTRKVVAAICVSPDPAGLIAAQREVLMRRIRDLLDAGPHPRADQVQALLREHSIAHTDADLKWLDLAAGVVRARSKERAMQTESAMQTEGEGT